MASTYRIAAHLSGKDLTRVDVESEFARGIRELFTTIRPRRVIETGTYRGTGTTTIIARTLRELSIVDSQFVSIEVNPNNVRRANEHLAAAGLAVKILNGLSVPRRLLPTIEQIERATVLDPPPADLIVDHEETDRAAFYFRETDFPDLPDDLLGQALGQFDSRPDFVLLDSGGHMGFVEFNYLVDHLAGPCFIALDDVRHVKHFRSFQQVRRDPRFGIVMQSDEKFGFCIARFTPAAAQAA